MNRPTDEELEERRTHPVASRAELRERLEPLVTEWRWATGTQYFMVPYARQMGERVWGKRLKSPPESPVGHYRYGFDAQGRLLIEREEDAYAGTKELFVLWDTPVTRSYYFSGSPQETPQTLEELAFDDAGRILHWARNGGGVIFAYDAYEYEGDKLARVVHWDGYSDGDVFRFEWKGNRLERVVRHYVRTGHDSVEWTAKPPSLRRALAKLAELLPGSVEDVVRAAGIDEPAFCVLLSYSRESPLEMSLPKVVVGLERERRRVLEAGGSAEDLFNPAGLELFDADALDLADPSLLTCSEELAMSLASDADYDKVQKAWVRLAKALNDVDWGPGLETSDGFVVLAVDDEVADLETNARATLSAARRKLLGL